MTPFTNYMSFCSTLLCKKKSTCAGGVMKNLYSLSWGEGRGRNRIDPYVFGYILVSWQSIITKIVLTIPRAARQFQLKTFNAKSTFM